MKVAELLERRREQWRELENLCRQMELRRVRRIGGPGVSRFASLYRAACADLALADAYQLPPDTVAYLHQLVGRSHNQLYRSQTFRWRTWGRAMFVELPPRLLRDRTVWLAMAIFWGIFGLSMLLGFSSRKYTQEAIGEAAMAQFKEMYSRPIRGRNSDMGGAMTGFYVMNNAGIGLRCFAAGLLLGVGGLFALVFNAVHLGAVFGYMLTIEQRTNFLHFVTAHGPFELTAVVFSAAAGMRMGFSLVATGGLKRGAALRRAAIEAAPVISSAVVLFCLAALIEGFVSPSNLPYGVKAAIALLSTAMLFFFVFVLGFSGEIAVQLDQARITICERSWVDNLDLALRVIRLHAAGVAASALAGILPIAACNYLLLYAVHTRRFPDEMTPAAYFFAVLLVMIEAPLATAPLTLYLGQALFIERPSAARIARDFASCLPQLLVLQLLLRALLIIPLVSIIVPYGIWPYLNEVILLERNPLAARRDQVSTWKRNSNLQRNNGADFLLRGLGALGLSLLLVVALTVTQRYLLNVLFGYHEGWAAQVGAIEAVLWLVVVFFTVARFLSYLDQRIRNEGWEVELFLRAERQRLARQVV